MPSGPLQKLRAPSRDSAPPTTDSETPPGDSRVNPPKRDSPVSRRGFLTGSATAASIGLAGCAGRVPGTAATVDAASRIDGEQLIWDYPARAVEGEKNPDRIGYAAVQLRVLDTAGPEQPADPILRFSLNSTVGSIEGYERYQADWFRFRLGVPRSYDDTTSLEASVQPIQWPEIQTTYGYHESRRDLVVYAPDVNSDGTIEIVGRFRPAGTTLPRQLYCGFEVHASRPSLLGESVVATDGEMFDVSTLDLPDGVTLK